MVAAAMVPSHALLLNYATTLDRGWPAVSREGDKRPSRWCFSVIVIIIVTKPSPLADSVAFLLSSAKILWFLPSVTRLSMNEWYVSFVQYIWPAAVFLRYWFSSS